MNFFFRRAGFSLFELLIGLGMVAILATVSVAYLVGYRNQSDLDSTAKRIVSTLRDAQNRSITQASLSTWGVHFDNASGSRPFWALFSGSYNSSSVFASYPLPPSVGFASATVPAAGFKELVFTQITGASSASTSIGIYLIALPSASATLVIASSGAVFY